MTLKEMKPTKIAYAVMLIVIFFMTASCSTNKNGYHAPKCDCEKRNHQLR